MAHNIDFTKTLLFVEGEKKGKLEGKLEGRLEAGKVMLEKGYTIFQVQDVTKLTFEQIQKLQDEMNK